MTNFYALFECGKRVQKAEQFIEDYRQDLKIHRTENSHIIEQIAYAYKIAATEAERAGWDKAIEFKREADFWQGKFEKLNTQENKPYNVDSLNFNVD